MGVEHVSLSQPCLVSFFSYKRVHQRQALMSESEIVCCKLTLDADDKDIYIYTSTFTQHVLASAFPNIKQFELDGSTLKQWWDTCKLHQVCLMVYIERMFTTMGPAFARQSANREGGAENGSEGQRDVPLGLKLPLYLYYTAGISPFVSGLLHCYEGLSCY